jgi:hypothetical protein
VRRVKNCVSSSASASSPTTCVELIVPAWSMPVSRTVTAVIDATWP